MTAEAAPAVEIHNLWKTYRIYSNPASRLIEGITGRPRHIDVPALSGLNFNIERGEAVGVIGRNGSGKSTLLRILAGIIDPSEGSFSIDGRVSSILDLGAGFITDFSGVENVYLNGRLMGMTDGEIESRLPGIMEFAGLGKYSELAVRTYSSGMLLRLGFAIAQCIDADVLLVDEILAVGDAAFQRKCLKRMNEFRERGSTIILVTHSVSDLGGFCDRVIQLEEGRVAQDGPTERVLKGYIEKMRDDGSEAGAPLYEHASPHRERTGDITIENVEFIGRDGPVSSVKTGESLTVRIAYRARVPVRNPLFRLQFRGEDGGMVHGTNTYRHGVDLGEMEGPGEIEIRYDCISLLEGRYYVTVGIYPDEYGLALADRAHDVRQMAYTLEVKSDRDQGAGVVFMPHKWERVK